MEKIQELLMREHWKPIEYRGIKQGEGRLNNNLAICPGQWGEYNATC